MQNPNSGLPSWEDVLNGQNSRRRSSAPSNPGNPGGSGPITTPGIPEDQVTHLPPPIGDWTTPPSTGPIIPPPRYEDLYGALPQEPDWGSGAPSTRYGGGGQRGYSGSPFGSYGNSGEQAQGFLSGLSNLFGGDGQTPDWLSNLGQGGFDGGRGRTGTPDSGSSSAIHGAGMVATGSPYTGRTGMSAADVEFWNMPADMQASYFERMAMKKVGDYDRSEPTYDNYGQIVDPGGEIVSGPKTTAIRQLMSDMAQTARAQMLSGYMPRVNY